MTETHTQSPTAHPSSGPTSNEHSGFDPAQLRCMEVWGGNVPAQNAVSTPGFDTWVSSTPYEGGAAGGDIHYLSMCAAGHITRFALADVSGHGEMVAESADRLRTIIRKAINNADQTKLVRQLNEQFLQSENSEHFATALVATYYAPERTLLMTNAGHPRPLWYRASTGAWSLITPEADGVRTSGAVEGSGLPLGVIQPTEYEQMAVGVEEGDLVVMYTDALIEAAPQSGERAGQQLGEQGLLDLANRLDPSKPESIASGLPSEIASYTGTSVFDDDVTLFVMHYSGAPAPAHTPMERLATIGRLLGVVK